MKCRWWEAIIATLYGLLLWQEFVVAHEEINNVKILSDMDFDSFVGRGKGPWLIEFTTEWCKACQNLQPAWRRAADVMKGEVEFGKIDCDLNKFLASRFHVTQFPSIFFIDKKADVYQFQGMGTVDALREFATTGYKQTKKMGGRKAPMGLQGRMKGMMMVTGYRIWAYGKSLVVDKGLPIWIVVMLMVFGGAGALLCFLWTIEYIQSPKRKPH